MWAFSSSLCHTVHKGRKPLRNTDSCQGHQKKMKRRKSGVEGGKACKEAEMRWMLLILQNKQQSPLNAVLMERWIMQGHNIQTYVNSISHDKHHNLQITNTISQKNIGLSSLVCTRLQKNACLILITATRPAELALLKPAAWRLHYSAVKSHCNNPWRGFFPPLIYFIGWIEFLIPIHPKIRGHIVSLICKHRQPVCFPVSEFFLFKQTVPRKAKLFGKANLLGWNHLFPLALNHDRRFF